MTIPDVGFLYVRVDVRGDTYDRAAVIDIPQPVTVGINEYVVPRDSGLIVRAGLPDVLPTHRHVARPLLNRIGHESGAVAAWNMRRGATSGTQSYFVCYMLRSLEAFENKILSSDSFFNFMLLISESNSPP